MSGVESHSAPLAKVAKLLDNRQIKNNRTAHASPLKNLITINIRKDEMTWNQLIDLRVGRQQNLHRQRLTHSILNDSKQLAIVNINVGNINAREQTLLSKDGFDV